MKYKCHKEYSRDVPKDKKTGLEFKVHNVKYVNTKTKPK